MVDASDKYGVKGKAVQPMRKRELASWLKDARRGSGKPFDFAVQREVAPPALWEGRKFSLRAYCLVACRGVTSGSGDAVQGVHTWPVWPLLWDRGR